MSFGFSIFDIASFLQLTWQVVEGAKAACGEHDDLTKEVVTLHTVLSHVESEMRDPDSILGNNKDPRLEGLGRHIKGCKDHIRRLDRLLTKYNSLSRAERSVQRLWQKAKFGNREIINVQESRQKIRTYTDAISITLQLFSAGSQSKVERQLNRQTGRLQGIQESVNLVLAKLTTTGAHDGSVMTDYHGDDKRFWRNLRRELVGAGFSSSALRGRERLIKNYVRELGEKGVLDERNNASSTTLPLIKELKIPHESIAGNGDVRHRLKRNHNGKAKEVVGVRNAYTKTESGEDSSADSESESSNTLSNGHDEDSGDDGDEDQESVLHDGKEESLDGSECESSSTDSEDQDVSDEDMEPVKADAKHALSTGSKSQISVIPKDESSEDVSDDDREQLENSGKNEGSTDDELVSPITYRDESDDDSSDTEPKAVKENGKKVSLTGSKCQFPVEADELEELETEDEVIVDDEDDPVRLADYEIGHPDEDTDFFFSASDRSRLRNFFGQETTSSKKACGHMPLFQASCKEVLDVEFIPGSHPNVVAPDFPRLCPESENPAPKLHAEEQKDIPVNAIQILEPQNTPQDKHDKWIFYPQLSLLSPKSRAVSFWTQGDTWTHKFQTRYDEYTTRTRDSIDKPETLIQITRKAPSSSDDAYAREISFWSEIVETHGAEGIIKLLYRRDFEAVFYAKVCGTVVQQTGYGMGPNDEDLKLHGIPDGYFCSQWDETKEPVCLNGNVFDIQSLGAHFHLWSAYIWGMESKQAKTASAFKTEMESFQDAFEETKKCLENIYKAGNVYPHPQQELVAAGNGIWKQLKGAVHKLGIVYNEDESADCRYARAFHDHVGEGGWVELREDMDKFCAFVYSEMGYEPLEECLPL